MLGGKVHSIYGGGGGEGISLLYGNTHITIGGTAKVKNIFGGAYVGGVAKSNITINEGRRKNSFCLHFFSLMMPNHIIYIYLICVILQVPHEAGYLLFQQEVYYYS